MIGVGGTTMSTEAVQPLAIAELSATRSHRQLPQERPPKAPEFGVCVCVWVTQSDLGSSHSGATKYGCLRLIPLCNSQLHLFLWDLGGWDEQPEGSQWFPQFLLMLPLVAQTSSGRVNVCRVSLR